MHINRTTVAVVAAAAVTYHIHSTNSLRKRYARSVYALGDALMLMDKKIDDNGLSLDEFEVIALMEIKNRVR